MGGIQVAKARTYSHYALEAVSLLGKQIKLARKRRKWTEHELSDRAGIARATLQKIERGDPGCAIGLVFEVATLVGVKLFDADEKSLAERHGQTDDRLALLPKAIHRSKKVLVDDF
jgi:transcriptional regulator with XRE-family HTH domain